MPLPDADTAGGVDHGVGSRLREAMITGIAITIPLIITLIVLGFVVNFISNALNPVVSVVDTAFQSPNVPDYAVKALAAGTLVVTMLLVGLIAQYRPGGSHLENSFDQLMARIPGVGSLYTSFNEMSELLLDSDTDSFQEVKLVEYPDAGSYTVAFLTADTPDTVEEATGHDDMMTLFLPMAPNPVMGGFVIHVSSDRVIDVDMTVQEGIRSIVTSGVAIEDSGDASLSASELEDLGHDPSVDQIAAAEPPGSGPAERTESQKSQTRLEEYDESVDPEHARHPRSIARRERPDPDEEAIADGTPRTPDDLETLSDSDAERAQEGTRDGDPGHGPESDGADED